MALSSALLILPSELDEKCLEKIASIINDENAVMLGLDPIWKVVVVKVESEVSVARKINSDGGGGGGRADATVQQKMN
ncbi:uncharacterized protein MONOS_16442 [Monocercomonoides exilis]|uniref:uncharacterized protein n=1 Tax=Monocercomonoides exilis TaxID=2049356 RepID=UPI00355A9D10|nr:hypothetical protein MONOS_16442 [Monocercomonoides exilis]|eukprot:MONOS_16442.1-p1 / transcript=MONOS_16442.1 / gene=MONOS_16442 / organism=Monocercomonoides_exilis_PA203 / gene_product=unspecified product / transcript_product=unspecified product / location=Mono_scaffold01742:3075-3308(+) / protein_length=78 / sequence_SO=supercontig / SO=protein_coding / is_pseudo=false